MLYITGITGHSGQWLFRRLEQEHYAGPIRLVMRKSKEEAPEKYKLFENTALQLEFAVGDLTDKRFLQESLSGVDTVIHISSISLSSQLVDAAIEQGVNWCILVHTTGRFSKFKSASAGYIQIEDDILKLRDKINITVLRPTMIYGSSRDRNMYRLVSYLSKYKVFPVFGKGDNLMQPVHARDLGNAYYDVLCHKSSACNNEYDLSGKAPVRYIDILQTVSRCLNRRNWFIHIPMGLSLFAAKLYNGLFGKRAIISVEQVMRMNEDKAFSHEAATRDFGYDPLSFEEGIREEVDEFLSGVRVDFSSITYK